MPPGPAARDLVPPGADPGLAPARVVRSDGDGRAGASAERRSGPRGDGVTSQHHDAFEAAHSVRPTDLVALVTFDGEIYENQAVPREHLVRPSAAPRPLGAAIEQWLGLGRQTWID